MKYVLCETQKLKMLTILSISYRGQQPQSTLYLPRPNIMKCMNGSN